MKTEIRAEIELRYCGFCGKTEKQVIILIAGPTAFICNECVDLCAVVVAEWRGRRNIEHLPERKSEAATD